MKERCYSVFIRRPNLAISNEVQVGEFGLIRANDKQPIPVSMVGWRALVIELRKTGFVGSWDTGSIGKCHDSRF